MHLFAACLHLLAVLPVLFALEFLLHEQTLRLVALLLPVTASCNTSVRSVLAAAFFALQEGTSLVVTDAFLLSLGTCGSCAQVGYHRLGSMEHA